MIRVYIYILITGDAPSNLFQNFRVAEVMCSDDAIDACIFIKRPFCVWCIAIFFYLPSAVWQFTLEVRFCRVDICFDAREGDIFDRNFLIVLNPRHYSVEGGADSNDR